LILDLSDDLKDKHRNLALTIQPFEYWLAERQKIAACGSSYMVSA
jgi:hypothetical protein